MSYRVGYLGPEATFANMAVNRHFPEANRIPYATIPDCMDAVADGSIDFAVVPLENAIEGSVNITIDYLIHEQPLYIVGEITLPVRQHLLVHPDHEATWGSTKIVYSHPHALAQCHKYMNTYLKGVRMEEMNSTSAAALYVKEHPEYQIGAIANELAAEKYGLVVVKKDIHTYPNNRTKFVVLHKQKNEELTFYGNKQGEKTTLMITLPSDYAGALYQVLAAFAWRKLNLSKIESRPMKTGLGNYFFIIDVEGPFDSILLPGAKMELEALGCQVATLGHYPCYE